MDSLSTTVLEKFNAEFSADSRATPQEDDLDQKIVHIYTKVGLILSRYKSGKIPKALKVLPSIRTWEQILSITEPEKWTPNATYQVTKVFVSNLTPSLVERFLRMFLLPKLRSDYAASRHVNVHHYMSLKKAIYKPTAFFKGIVLPLCEATIISSVIAKTSIPSIYSAVALAKLCQLDYTGPRSIFLRTMLDKKYALPLPLIGVILAFLKKNTFDDAHRPVLWHQCLLVLVQRYNSGFSDEQKREILGLVSRHRHPEMGLEIERELSGQSESRVDYMEQ